MEKKKSPHPEWAVKHRKPGTELRKIGNRYYLYEVSAFYDKELKKSRKKTVRFLGAITEADGFVEAVAKKVPKTYKSVEVKNISTKEYGMSAFIQNYCADIVEPMKVHFPHQWEWMLVALYCRLLHTSPMKNMGYYYKKSFLSQQLDVSVTGTSISLMIKDLGKDRTSITDYLRQLCGKADGLMLIDATSIVSYSENLSKVHLGLSKDHNYEPLFNLLYFYSPKNYLPTYYRLFNGNIKDVSMISTAIKETGYEDTIIVADKGFYSENNITLLEEQELRYIIPLKRNSSLIDYKRYEHLTRSKHHFLYEGRVIYYDSYAAENGRTIYLFTDEQMMIKEKRDYIIRVEKQISGYTQEQFVEKLPGLGSFSAISNISTDAQTIFLSYKSRAGVEILFDGVKNILGNDYTYMQNDDALEGWMFINHLALLVHHKIYALLKENRLISKYSIRDFIEYLADLKKVRINNEWILEPIILEQKKLLQKLKIDIT